MSDEQEKHIVYERQICCRQKEMGSDEIKLEAGAVLTSDELIGEYQRVHTDGTAKAFDAACETERKVRTEVDRIRAQYETEIAGLTRRCNAELDARYEVCNELTKSRNAMGRLIIGMLNGLGYPGARLGYSGEAMAAWISGKLDLNADPETMATAYALWEPDSGWEDDDDDLD